MAPTHGEWHDSLGEISPNLDFLVPSILSLVPISLVARIALFTHHFFFTFLFLSRPESYTQF